MSRDSIDLVREFHVAFSRPVRDLPGVGSAEERVLRVRLMLEEVLEFAKAAGVAVFKNTEPIEYIQDLSVHAWGEPRLAQMAHELADVEYVVNGTAVQLGIPLSVCIAEIHAANMRKLSPEGKPIVDAHGKVRKPEGWKPADVAQVLRRSVAGSRYIGAGLGENDRSLFWAGAVMDTARILARGPARLARRCASVRRAALLADFGAASTPPVRTAARTNTCIGDQMPSDRRLAPFRDLDGVAHKPLDVPKSVDGMQVVAVADPRGPMIQFATGRWRIRYGRSEVMELIARLQEWVDDMEPKT